MNEKFRCLFCHRFNWRYIAFTIAPLSLLITLSVHFIKNESKINHKLNHNTRQLELVFDEILGKYGAMMSYLGSQIVTQQIENDPDAIASLIKDFHKFVHFIWSDKKMRIHGINWISNEAVPKIVGQYGVLDSSLYAEDSDFERCSRLPGTLHVSRLLNSDVIPGLKILQLHWGVLDSNGSYIGQVCLRLNAAELIQLIQHQVGENAFSYVVLDENLQVVIESLKNVAVDETSAELDLTSKGSFPLLHRGIKFSYEHKMSHLPYTILYGFEPSSFRRDFFLSLGYSAIWVLGILIFLFALLSLHRKMVLHPLQDLFSSLTKISEGDFKKRYVHHRCMKYLSIVLEVEKIKSHLRQARTLNNRKDKKIKDLEACLKTMARKNQSLKLAHREHLELEYISSNVEKEREKFYTQLSHKMSHTYNEIIERTKVISNHVRGVLDIDIDKEKHLALIDKICANTLEIASVSIYPVNFDYIDVNNSIADILKMHAKAIFLRKIQMTTKYSSKLKPVFSDVLTFKQIVSSLFVQSLESVPKGGSVALIAYNKVIHDMDFLTLVIKDDGFNLEMSTKDEEENLFNLLEVKVETMRDLIEGLGGHLVQESLGSKGKVVTLSFPCRPLQKEAAEEVGAGKNVYKLF